jgi:uncharacterized membrane protein
MDQSAFIPFILYSLSTAAGYTFVILCFIYSIRGKKERKKKFKKAQKEMF